MGRPRSIFTGQLHMRVLPEDEVWFKALAEKRLSSNGKILHEIRKAFERDLLVRKIFGLSNDDDNDEDEDEDGGSK